MREWKTWEVSTNPRQEQSRFYHLASAVCRVSPASRERTYSTDNSVRCTFRWDEGEEVTQKMFYEFWSPGEDLMRTSSGKESTSWVSSLVQDPIHPKFSAPACVWTKIQSRQNEKHHTSYQHMPTWPRLKNNMYD